MQVWDLGLWKGRLDGLREALEAVHDRDKDVLNAPVAQIVQHLCPELGTLVGLEPQAQNVARAVRQNRQCDKDSLVRHRAVIADIDPDRVHEHHRIAGLKRAVLPRGDFLHHRLGDRRDQAGGRLEAVDFLDMPLNLTGGHAARIHADDLAVELGKSALILGDQQRVEGAVAVARDVQDDLAGVGRHRLLAAAVAAIGRPVMALRRVFCALLAKMLFHLGRQRAFRQRLGLS